MTRHLRRLGNTFSIPIDVDENGYLGRECPECEKYFKITPGTGITEGTPPCHCPYCGHVGGQDDFFTKAQIEYAQSIVMRQLSDAFVKDLKALEFDYKPRGGFGIGMSMKVEAEPMQIYQYSEMDLEEEVVCDCCTLRYTVFGSFAYCPDCGRHNSRQILGKNIDLASKIVKISSEFEAEIQKQLIADALENGVSAFDGFGREVCSVYRSKATEPDKAENVSFQNLFRAHQKVESLFGIDIRAAITTSDWEFLIRCFQKRHLLAHKMGIVDDAYMQATQDREASVGRKVSISAEEVCQMLDHLNSLGEFLSNELESHS